LDSFAVLTEFAVALAGFSGIVIAIGNRDGAMDGLTRFRNGNLLLMTLGAAFGSVWVPMLASFGLEGEALWRATSLCLAPLVLAIPLHALQRSRRLAEAERAQLSLAIWWLAIGGTLLTSPAMLVNAAGILAPAQPGPIFAALVFLLFIATVQFFRILAGVPGRRNDPTP
jgi:hypothetical protein